MNAIRVWDPVVRLFHWGVALAVVLNLFVLDEEGMYHRWAGYVVAALVVVRVIWGFAGSRHARFKSFPPSIKGSLAQLTDMLRGGKVAHLGHTPLGALMIYNLLLTLAVVAGTGYLMTTDMFWGVEWPEDLHKGAVTWLEVSVAGHIAAVVYESVRTRINLPFAMITGKKRIPDGTTLTE